MHRPDEVSERQKNIINMLLDGFEGKLTTEKNGESLRRLPTTRRFGTSRI
jgi:hypothetical protein